MTCEEIDQDVQQSLEERLEDIEEAPSRHICTKMRVLFESGKQLLDSAGEFESLEPPDFVLQDAVFGNSLKNLLYEKGRNCLSPAIVKGFGLPVNAKVAGVILSTEMLYATKVDVGKEKIVRGYPFLVVAGQNSEGYCKIIIRPLVVDDEENKVYSESVVLTDKMADVIKKIEKAKPFMGPFFDGLGKGNSNVKGFVIFKD